MFVAGIDIGSVTTKGVLYDGKSYKTIYQPTGFDPATIGDTVIQELQSQYKVSAHEILGIYGTGYGRIHLPQADEIFSEITCQGRGCNYLFPGVGGILDVGGQDSKAMRINQEGKVKEFVLNDKCAAGTGRFLEVSLNALGITLKQIDDIADQDHPVDIGSMCSVFCETEVLNLLMQGEDKGKIVAGLLKSIATRVAAMIKKVSKSDEIVFTGGISQSLVMRHFLAEMSGFKVHTPENPVVTAALGAAILGYEKRVKQ